jgi:hypothetical protein
VLVTLVVGFIWLQARKPKAVVVTAHFLNPAYCQPDEGDDTDFATKAVQHAVMVDDYENAQPNDDDDYDYTMYAVDDDDTNMQPQEHDDMYAEPVDTGTQRKKVSQYPIVNMATQDDDACYALPVRDSDSRHAEDDDVPQQLQQPPIVKTLTSYQGVLPDSDTDTDTDNDNDNSNDNDNDNGNDKHNGNDASAAVDSEELYPEMTAYPPDNTEEGMYGEIDQADTPETQGPTTREVFKFDGADDEEDDSVES